MNSGNCKKSYILILDHPIKEGNLLSVQFPLGVSSMPCCFSTDTHVIVPMKFKIQEISLLLPKMQSRFDISGAQVTVGRIKTASEPT